MLKFILAGLHWKPSSIFNLNPSPFHTTATNAQICSSKDSKKHRKYCSHQNGDMLVVLLSTMLRSFHQFLIVLLSHQRLVKLTSDGSGIGFQFLDLIPGVASKDGPCD